MHEELRFNTLSEATPRIRAIFFSVWGVGLGALVASSAASFYEESEMSVLFLALGLAVSSWASTLTTLIGFRVVSQPYKVVSRIATTSVVVACSAALYMVIKDAQ